MSTDSNPERTAALRDALVATANDAPPRRPRRRAIIASIAAFALAGGVAGVVSTAAFASGLIGDGGDDVSVIGSLAYIGALQADGASNLVGTPVSGVATGTATWAIDPAPAGVNSLIVSFQCLGEGSISVDVDGLYPSTTCNSASDKPISVALMPSTAPGAPQPTGTNPPSVAHHLRVQSNGTKYAVWVSWVLPTADSSEQKAALADGKVTRAEYLDAYHRMQGCMTAGGHAMGIAPEDSTVIGYVVSDNNIEYFDVKCYPQEFEDVDIAWQIAHEDDGK